MQGTGNRRPAFSDLHNPFDLINDRSWVYTETSTCGYLFEEPIPPPEFKCPKRGCRIMMDCSLFIWNLEVFRINFKSFEIQKSIVIDICKGNAEAFLIFQERCALKY